MLRAGGAALFPNVLPSRGSIMGYRQVGAEGVRHLLLTLNLGRLISGVPGQAIRPPPWEVAAVVSLRERLGSNQSQTGVEARSASEIAAAHYHIANVTGLRLPPTLRPGAPGDGTRVRTSQSASLSAGGRFLRQEILYHPHLAGRREGREGKPLAVRGQGRDFTKILHC